MALQLCSFLLVNLTTFCFPWNATGCCLSQRSSTHSWSARQALRRASRAGISLRSSRLSKRTVQFGRNVGQGMSSGWRIGSKLARTTGKLPWNYSTYSMIDFCLVTWIKLLWMLFTGYLPAKPRCLHGSLLACTSNQAPCPGATGPVPTESCLREDTFCICPNTIPYHIYQLRRDWPRYFFLPQAHKLSCSFQCIYARDPSASQENYRIPTAEDTSPSHLLLSSS